MVSHSAWLRAFLLTFCLGSFAQADTIVDVTAFGAVPNSGQDATVAFQSAIASAASAPKPVTLNIPAGRYDFWSTNAVKRACYCSNATEPGSNAIRTIALDLSNLNQCTVQGNGSTMMMRGAMTMVVAENSTNLTLTCLTFDFARPAVSEVTVLSIGTSSWIGQVNPDCTYTITGGNRILWTGEDWQSYHNMCQPYDPNTKTTWRGNDPTTSATSIVDLGNGQLKFFVPSATLSNAVVGRTYQFRDTTRDQVGMWFNHCQGVTLRDVNVYSMRGFGILGQFTDGIHFQRLNVVPKPGRTCASGADIVHFSGCKGLINIENSTLSAAQDDAMNVHGTHLQIQTLPAPNQIKVGFMQSQSWGFLAFQPGDQIEFVKASTLLSYGTAVVTSVQQPDLQHQVLTLDRNAPAGVTLNSDVIENITWIPSVQVTNCDIGQVPTRGILVTTRQPVTISGCRFFRLPMPPVLVADDASSWYESGPVRNLTLDGNAFYEGSGSYAIEFLPNNSTYAGAIHSSITISNNDFTLTGSSALHFSETSNISVTGNRFRMRNNSTPTVSAMTATSNVSGLTYSNNTVEVATTPAIAANNGSFEAPVLGPNDEVSAAPANWWGPADGTVRQEGSGRVLSNSANGYTASQSLLINPGGYVYQRVGPFDPTQGGNVRWSVTQLKSAVDGTGSGPLAVQFYAWDGIFAAGANTDPAASGMELLGSFSVPSLPASKASRIYPGNLDLSAYPAGTAVWVRLSNNSAQAARIDDFSTSLSPAPNLSYYGGWASNSGLSGSDAAPQADPNGDGVPNLVEYALEGGDPLGASSSPLYQMRWAGSHLQFVFQPRQVSDVSVTPEFQFGGLAGSGWQPVQDGQNGMSYFTQSGESIVDFDPALTLGVFFHLKVSVLPTPPPSVINPSFESPNLTGLTPAYSSTSPAGWTFTGTANGGVEDIRDNRFGPLGPAGSKLDVLGGQGNQVGYINLGNSGWANALSDPVCVVAPNTIYTLRVAFGQRDPAVSTNRSPQGSFGLSVNGVDVGTFTPLGALATGFNQRVYTWQSPAMGDPLVGQPMRIHMAFTYDTASGNWQQAQFDNVRLDAAPAP